jgi:hypothetical protein
MMVSGRPRQAAVILLVVFFLGCAVPTSATPPLTAAAARNTLDSWNPDYCKVVEFYGFYKAEGPAPTQVAYVLLANPGDKAQKQTVFAARFQLLTLPDGQQKWFLTSLMSHGAGLSRRQGWDNLIVPVTETPPAPSQ